MMKNQNDKKVTRHSNFVNRLERSSIIMILGIILLFSTAIIVTLIAPRYVDSTWTSPSSHYQVQMYEIEDPNLYISSQSTHGKEVQYVHHLKKNFSLLSFKENENLRFISSPELEKYLTRYNDPTLKLTSRLLFLREPLEDKQEEVEKLQKKLQEEWASHQAKETGIEKINFQILELYDPNLEEAFSIDLTVGILPNWVDENYVILDEISHHPYHRNPGVVFIQNPQEFRVTESQQKNQIQWKYDPNGKAIKNLEELKSSIFGFYSRQELIYFGEHLYAIEGCWYCHTDQTRTLIQDTVLNGSDSFPAPPSSANEYIYQKITFPGTRRIGPDLSRVGVKRPSRDWHQAHFWAPKTASVGSIMPAFQHFFDNDPRGTGNQLMGIPNYKFEAIYQYMMTKGTRITAPTKAWWLGKDPIQTKEIIEGRRVYGPEE